MITIIIILRANVDIMKLISQCHVLATINMGGAAKGVIAPPIEMLTKRIERITYLSFSDWIEGNRVSFNIMALTVIAAGSVINEPSRGRSVRVKK
jgi:hypothetical protein